MSLADSAEGLPLSQGEPGGSIAERMRWDIRTGRLAAGSPLRVQELAAYYEVSAIPIREALQLLRGEGIVHFSANKGARVRKLDVAAVRNICGVLEAMESYYARRFAETASPFQMDALEAIEDRHEEALAGTDMRQIMALNNEFHDYVNRSADNPAADELVWRQKVLLGTLRVEVGFGEVRRVALSAEHRGIIEAARKGDPDEAARVAAMHARSSKDDLVERIMQRDRKSTSA